ncbi:MAG: acyl carrier protein [Bacteroidales bacterium]
MPTQLEIRLQNIFREILKLPALEFTRGTSPSDVPEWGSLNHVRLIAALEKEMQVRFTLDELMEMNSVGAILDILEKKNPQ